jgi:hypothetical protein
MTTSQNTFLKIKKILIKTLIPSKNAQKTHKIPYKTLKNSQNAFKKPLKNCKNQKNQKRLQQTR